MASRDAQSGPRRHRAPGPAAGRPLSTVLGMMASAGKCWQVLSDASSKVATRLTHRRRHGHGLDWLARGRSGQGCTPLQGSRGNVNCHGAFRAMTSMRRIPDSHGRGRAHRTPWPQSSTIAVHSANVSWQPESIRQPSAHCRGALACPPSTHVVRPRPLLKEGLRSTRT